VTACFLERTARATGSSTETPRRRQVVAATEPPEIRLCSPNEGTALDGQRIPIRLHRVIAHAVGPKRGPESVLEIEQTVTMRAFDSINVGAKALVTRMGQTR
jgi:hypothetical protein